jgi:hypothetical protein
MAGILVTKRVTFKAGVFINTSEVSRLSLVYYRGPTNKVGTNNWNYYPNRIQAGFVIGMSTVLGPKKQWNFNILMQQFANDIIDKDITIQGVTFNNPHNSIFSRRCKPTLLLLGFSCILKELGKNKSHTE